MSVLIKGMEMPNKKNGAVLIIYPNGKCAFEDGQMYQVVSVPKHGRLIDADALFIDLMDMGIEGVQTDDLHEIQQAVSDAPTVIPAEEGE